MQSDKAFAMPLIGKNYDKNNWEHLRDLLHTVKAVRGVNFSVRMNVANEGIIAEIGEVLNDIIELNENMANVC